MSTVSLMKELADTLKEERLKQGLTLDAVSKRVNVSVSVLQALEEAEFHRIGTAILIRSFIRSYCSALGIDPVPLLEKFGGEIQACDRQDENIQRYGVWSRSFRTKKRIGFFGILLLLIVLVGAIYGGSMIAQRRARLAALPSADQEVYPQQELPSDLPDRKMPKAAANAMKQVQMEAAKPAQSAPAAPEPKVEKASEPAAKPAEPVAAAPVPVASTPTPSEVLPEERPAVVPERPQKSRLAASASQKAWIEVRVDGKPAQNLMMQNGEKREWEVDKEVRVTLGKSGAIRLTWNGVPVSTPANSKRVVRLHLPDPKLAPEPGRNVAE